MMCPRCQQESPSQAKFSVECGTPLAFRCSNSRTRLLAAAKFRFECSTADERERVAAHAETMVALEGH